MKDGKAKIVKHHPFTIQLLYDSKTNTQPIEICEDVGYNYIGISVKSESHEYVSAQYDTLQDEKEHHDDCRKYRRTRRNRLRYRKPRFDNRKRGEGWLAPSLRHKKELNVNVVKMYCAVMPITHATVEVGSFDTMLVKAIQEGKAIPEGADYQKGPRYNLATLREAVFYRDNYTCQVCGRKVADGAILHIFFNEFNRYRGKAQAGQVFTPDHIASFMYRLIEVNKDDHVLDATCGSGTFLVKSMCNMIHEAGGSNTNKAKEIKSGQLFGIEMYRKVYALACANMMIHKDGKTNLVQMDAKSQEASDWIKKQHITKVLMNPPYERKYGCAAIVSNVLDSVPAGTKCAFILPDKKMEKESKLKSVLEKHTLTTIVKLPENLFFGLGVTTSIFIFETGKPQNGRNIKGYYVADDGLETVKNKGRQDVHDKWPALEDYWVKAIQDDNDNRYNTRQLINPAEHLSFQMPEKPFELYEEDFIKTVMDYEMYKRGINAKEFGDKLLQKVLYGSTVTGNEEGTNILVEKGENDNGED